MRSSSIISFIIIVFVLSCGKGGSKNSGGEELKVKNTRPAAVSGSWYPSNPESLRKMVQAYMDQAKLPTDIKGELIGIISPHAGFVYSGPVAGYCYKYIQMNKEKFKGRTFIIVGPSHYMDFRGIAIYPDGAFETPLGEIPVDTELSNLLQKDTSLVKPLKDPHMPEHSLEAQLPFLQVALGGDFKIVPLLYGRAKLDDVIMFGERLAKIVKEHNAVIIASTDMSHYHPYDVAVRMDSATIEATKKLDINELVEGLEEGTMELCGYLPVLTLMRTASVAGVSEGTLLKYANSGDVPHGDKSRVVGYFAMLFLSERVGEKEKGVEVEFNLTLEQKKYLLRLARQTIEEYVRNGRRPEIKAPDDPVLVRDGAVFVTIHHKGQLRGCIGQMVAQEPLYKAVMDMAISAATRDYRFPPVKAQELGDIDIEISVLSPLKRIDDWRKIKLGEHGVYIRKGYNSGVFLPQVGRMPGFTLESFLGELCEQKAGLARDCYKDPDAEIYIFTVVEFDESIMKEGK